MKPLIRLLVLLVLAGACLEAKTLGQQPPDRPVRPAIRVNGEATVTAKPDQAEINIGVVTQASTGQAAATQNAQKQDAVLAELRKVLGTAPEIKTISYSLTPNYRYPRDGGQPTITGYTATRYQCRPGQDKRPHAGRQDYRRRHAIGG
jgi:uncharacterized protein YggE